LLLVITKATSKVFLMQEPARLQEEKNNKKSSYYNFHNEGQLRVSQAARILGISPSTLRRHEEGGLISSTRLENNYRVYNLSDIKILEKKLKELSHKKSQLPQHTSRIKLAKKIKVPSLNFNFPIPKYALPVIFLTGAILLFGFKTFNVKDFSENILSYFFKNEHSEVKSSTNDTKVLAAKNRVTDYVYNINIPTNINNDLTVSGIANLYGGLDTNGADGDFGTGDVTLGTLTFSGTAQMNNLQDIDEVTEDTLEEYIDIDGDVVGTGLTDVEIKSGVITGEHLADEVEYEGDWDFTGTWSVDGSDVTATADELNTFSGLTTTSGGVYYGDGSGLAQDATQLYWDATNDRLGIGTTSPTASVDIVASSLTEASLRIRSGTAPSSPNTGDIYSDGSAIYYYDGSSWDDLSSAGTLSSLQTAYETGSEIELSAGEGDLRVYNDAGTELLFLDEDTGRVGVGTTSPGYKLDVNGSFNATSYYLSGTEITATATEINLLDGRSGVLIDNNNISSYVIAGNGLVEGGSAGVVQLNVGAGNGITVNANSITMDVTTSGATSSSASNSGLEVTGDGLRLLGGCGDDEVLQWDAINDEWTCTALSIGGTVTGNGQSGQLTFWDGASSVDGNYDLYWNNSLSRLGVGTSAPSYLLDVNGTGRIDDVYINSNNIGLVADTDLISLASGALTINGTINDLTVNSGEITAGSWKASVIEVSYGGTGVSSIPANALVVGSGTAPISTLSASTAAQLLISNAANAPSFATMSGDATLSALGALTLENSGVSTGTYGGDSSIPVISVDSKGRITSASNVDLSSTFESPLTFSNGLTRTGDSIKLGGALTESTRLYDGSYEYIYFDSSDGNVGIGITDPSYKLHVSGSASVDNLVLSGTAITANATELNLLDGRSGTLIDTVNIGSNAVTSLTAGEGLTSTGGTVGDITLNIDLAASDSSSTTSSISGLEITSDKLRLIGGCSSDQVLAWDGNSWDCADISSISDTTSSSGASTQVSFFDGANSIIGDSDFTWTTGTSTLDITGNLNVSAAANIAGVSIAGNAISSGTWNGDTVSVSYGGTGTTTLTSKGLLIGNGTSSIYTTSAPSGGQIIVGNASGIPSFVTMGGDATINATGAIDLSATGVVAGTYGSTSAIPVISVDDEGRISSLTTSDISSTYESPLTFSNGISRTGDAIKLGGALTESTRIYDGSYEYLYL